MKRALSRTIFLKTHGNLRYTFVYSLSYRLDGFLTYFYSRARLSPSVTYLHAVLPTVQYLLPWKFDVSCRGVASNEAEEAVACLLTFCARTRARIGDIAEK